MTAKGLFLNSQHIPQDCKWEPICSGSTSFLLLCYFDFNFPFGQEHLPAGGEEERVEKSATVFLHFSLISLLSLELNWQLSDYTPGTALSSLYCVHVLNPYNTPARKVYIYYLYFPDGETGTEKWSDLPLPKVARNIIELELNIGRSGSGVWVLSH